jgi:hypothetical protein
MKWGSSAKSNDTRILKKYAWFPIRIRDKWNDPKIQWRWLETVKIRQEYNTTSGHLDIGIIEDIKIYLFGGYWENLYFVELSKSEKRDEKLKKLGL